MTRKQQGYSLLELLITLSIISILSSIALPLYSQHITHENRLEAAQMLSKLAIAMEHYQIENNSYSGASLSNLNFSDAAIKNTYQLEIQTFTDDQYLLSAIPINKQAENDEACGVLKLNSAGEKLVTGSDSIENCW